MSLEGRLLEIPRKDGLYSAAAQVAIFREIEKGKSLPTLMFAECTPTVSIGNSQSYALDVDHEACDRNNVSVVRRTSAGQAVYVDGGYLVFALLGPRKMFDKDLTRLRAHFSTTIADALKSFGLPAKFYKPDNVIITKPMIKTIGNSGQFVSPHAVMAQGSVRYSSDGNEMLLETLKTNGHKLQLYREDALKVLADVKTYAPAVSKDQVKAMLISMIAGKYGLELKKSGLTPLEMEATAHHLSTTFGEQHLRDEPHYPSRGVCYFFLNGNNLIPAMRDLLPYNAPSRLEDSTERTEVYHG